MSNIQFTEDHWYEIIKRACSSNTFKDSHNIFTPKSVAKNLLNRVQVDGTVLVLFNVEFVVSLVYTYNVDPEKITFYSDHSNKNTICDELGIKYITSLDADMKFDVVVGNPPYKQGLWRSLMQKALHLSKKHVLLVSPDCTTKTSRRNADMKAVLEEGGIQSVIPCQKAFKAAGIDVVTSSEICYYVFDKTTAFNPQVFNKPLTNEDLLTQSIVDKIKAKKVNGTLGMDKIGSKNKKSTGKVLTLQSVRKSGAILDQEDRNKVRVISNSQDCFYSNRFFGMNPVDEIYHHPGGDLGVSSRIYAIGNIGTFTVDQFKKIYLSKLMRLYLGYFRGTNKFCLGWSIKELPIVPATTTNLYSYFGLTQAEIDHVETTIK